jgi:cytochrome c553
MAREDGSVELANPWPRIAWWVTAAALAISMVLGFVVLGREQQNGSPLGAWTAFCHALGIAADTGPVSEPQPPLVTPTRIAWTGVTLATVASGNAARGAFVALNCTACHGEGGISAAGLYPTLARMDDAVIYKQLDDFRAGKRQSGVMNAIGNVLSPSASADVAAYFAGRPKGLMFLRDGPFPSGHTLREKIPPFVSCSPEIRRWAFRPAPPVTVLPATSSGRRRCKASNPPISNASSRPSPRAGARMTSMNKCAQSRDS